MSWPEDGACYNSNSEIFFPQKAEMSRKDYDETVQRAMAVCGRCLVTEQCAEASKEETFGIWAGVLK